MSMLLFKISLTTLSWGLVILKYVCKLFDTSPFKKWSLITPPLNVDWELVTGFEQITCGVSEDRWFLRLGLKKKKLLPGTHIILLSQIALGEASCHIMKTAKDPRKGSMWEGTQASRQQTASTCPLCKYAISAAYMSVPVQRSDD